MTATQQASTLKPGEIVRWDELERAAFEDFPQVVLRLRNGNEKKFSKIQVTLFILLGTLVVVIYATPIWAVATVVGPWALSQTSRTAQGDIAVAGVIFIVSLVMLLALFVIWFIQDRPAQTPLRGSAIMNVVLGLLSAGVVVVRGTDKSVPDWGLWVLPMVASALVGAVALLLIQRERKRAPLVSQANKEQPTFKQSADHVAAVRARVERVCDEDQRAIRSDLDSAIEDLARRGVITAMEATAARAAKLGELGIDMTRAQLQG